MAHMVKEHHQRGTSLVREVRLILFNVSLKLRKPVLALGKAIMKNVE